MVGVAYAESPEREIYELNDGWQLFSTEEFDSDASKYVSLPHTWNTEAAENAFDRTTYNYVRSINVPEEWSDKRLFMRFGGAQSVATLFVNGRYVGEHHGGYTAFIFEITDYLSYGENLLRVEVSNERRSDLLPASSDADLAGGLYRGVELMVTQRNIISPLRYATNGVFVEQQSVSRERVEGVVRVYLSMLDVITPTLNMRVVGPDGYEVCSRSLRVTKYNAETGVVLPFEIVGAELWSPFTPSLYRFEISLDGEGGRYDDVTVETGLRKVAVNEYNKLTINDYVIDVHGAGLPHDRKGYGTACDESMFMEDYERMRDMGLNALRSLCGPHTAALYDSCDRDGMLVWIDMPFTRSPLSFVDVCYYPTEAFRDNGFEQLREIVAQNYNHPSVVMWGLFSLVWQRGDDVVPYVRELNELAHALDSSRLTVGCSNSDGEINFITDLIVLRQNVGWSKGQPDDVAIWCRQLASNETWSQLRYGVCYGEEGIRNHYTDRLQRASRGERLLPERRQTYMHERYADIISQNDIFWGVWLETMFDYASSRRAYGVNHSGLVDYDHQEAKDAYYLYRSMWNSSSPTLRITGRTWRERRDTLQQIDLYSSEGEPLLFVGLDTIPLRSINQVQWRADSVVVHGSTVIRALNESNDLRDSIKFRVVSGARR